MGAIAWRYMSDEQLLVTVWDGKISPEEHERHRQTLTVDPDIRCALSDLTTADTSALSPESYLERLRRTNVESAHRYRGVRIAMVAASSWNLAKAYETFTRENGVENIVFNHLDLAARWLGINGSRVDQVVAELRTEARERSREP